MLLNAKQFRASRGFKLYTSNRINDKKALNITGEIKAITASQIGDKHSKVEESCTKENENTENDLNGIMNGENALVDGADGEIKEKELRKKDEPNNDDSDFKKWFQNSELGRNKSGAGEGKRDGNKNLESRDCVYEVERDCSGNDVRENVEDNFKDLEIGEDDAKTEACDHAFVNETSNLPEFTKAENNSHLTHESRDSKTDKNLNETNEILKGMKDENSEDYFYGKQDFNLNDFIPEDEFKIVNHKKKKQKAVKKNASDTHVIRRPQKEARDQRSSRRFNKATIFNRNQRSGTFKDVNKMESNKSALQIKSATVLKSTDLEIHTNTSDLESSKRTDSEGQSSLSSSSSITSDLPPSPSTLSSSPSPQPPNYSPSPTNAQLNDASTPNNEETTDADTSTSSKASTTTSSTSTSSKASTTTSSTSTSSKASTTTSTNETNLTSKSSKNTPLSNSTTSTVFTTCISYSKIINSLNKDKIQKEISHGKASIIDQSIVKNKSQSKKAFENSWHKRTFVNANKTNDRTVRNKTPLLPVSSSKSDITSHNPESVNGHHNNSHKHLTNEIAQSSSSKCHNKPSPSPCYHHHSDQPEGAEVAERTDGAEGSLQSHKGVRTKENQTQGFKIEKNLQKSSKLDTFQDIICKEKVLINRKKKKLMNRIVSEEKFNLKATQEYLMRAFEEHVDC